MCTVHHSYAYRGNTCICQCAYSSYSAQGQWSTAGCLNTGVHCRTFHAKPCALRHTKHADVLTGPRHSTSHVTADDTTLEKQFLLADSDCIPASCLHNNCTLGAWSCSTHCMWQTPAVFVCVISFRPAAGKVAALQHTAPAIRKCAQHPARLPAGRSK